MSGDLKCQSQSRLARTDIGPHLANVKVGCRMRFNHSVFVVVESIVFFAPFAACGQGLPVKQYLPQEVAQTAASVAVAKCKADGFSVTVFVLDRIGEPIIMMRGDNASPHHVDSARRKAFTALTFKMPSAELAPFIAKNPSAAALADLNGIIALGGGLPIKSGDDIVGSIGVAGAPVSDKDVACAQAGLDSIASRLNGGPRS
jgi:uncharacterized protein GlcG (DUF336 family)